MAMASKVTLDKWAILGPEYIYKIFSLVPSKKNCHQRKLRQTKCLLFDFWMIKLTVIP